MARGRAARRRVPGRAPEERGARALLGLLTGPPYRAAAAALLPFALHGLARESDAALGLLLHSSLDVPDLVPRALGLVAWPRAVARALLWCLAGLGAWCAAAAWHGRRLHPSSDDLLAACGVFTPLLLRPALSALALLALWVRPAYPYGFTLPVALTQDWSAAQDLACAATLVACLAALGRRPACGGAPARPRLAGGWAPRSWELGFAAFLGYALLTPASAREWQGHPGNEPKYLRMAVALGHFGSLDVERVSAPMEELAAEPAGALAARVLSAPAGAAVRLAGALARGAAAWEQRSIRAQPLAHLTVRGPDGGAYHVLAPGPALLLAPALRADRTLNRALGRRGRLAVALLLWNALAAALVAALYGLMRASGVTPGLAGAAAALVAATPPLSFYAYQFYPEPLAALLLVLVLRAALFGRASSAAALLRLGLLLMPLPWLHQKYLPLWAALVLTLAVLSVERLVGLRALLGLLLPQALSALAVLLYNHALSGSPRPDALFRALGRSGVSASGALQGLLGLAFDARYGLVPYAPWLLLAPFGMLLAEPGAQRLRVALPAAAVYYVTVASADNWTGSISNLGRFVLPLVPLLAAFAALGVQRALRQPGALALALTLAALGAALGLALWRDPAAANDCAVLLGRASFADGNSYLPSLLVRSLGEAAPGLLARLLAWALLAAVAGAFLARAARGRAGASAPLTLAGLVALVLALAFGLEHWPTARRAARFDGVRLDASTVLHVAGNAAVEEQALVLGPGRFELLVRAPSARSHVLLSGVAPARLEPGALEVAGGSLVALEALASLKGRRGNREWLGRARLSSASALRTTARLPPCVDTAGGGC